MIETLPLPKQKKKSSMLGGNLFWNMFIAYRALWICGRYGGGKTSLGVLMAAKLLAEKRVSGIVSNIPLTFARPIPDDKTELSIPALDLGILLDESWIYIDTRQAVLDYAGFIRKFNHFLILSSVFPVHPRLSYFYVQRIFNAYTIGLPFWVYRWNIANKGIKENGLFAIRYPVACFGHYPTDFVPSDDGRISEMVTKTSAFYGYKGLASKTKKNADLRGLDFRESNYDESEVIAALDDSSLAVSDARDDISKIAKALSRARR